MARFRVIGEAICCACDVLSRYNHYTVFDRTKPAGFPAGLFMRAHPPKLFAQILLQIVYPDQMMEPRMNADKRRLNEELWIAFAG